MKCGKIPLSAMDYVTLFGILYLLVGGSFILGQAVAVEVGRYLVWERRRRFLISHALGLFAIVIAFALLSIWSNPLFYPLALFCVLSAGKLFFHQMNRFFPRTFQPREEEIRAKYGGAFSIDEGEISAILDDEFVRKLGFRRVRPEQAKRISFLDGDEEEKEEGLRGIVEEFIKKRRKRGWM